MKDLIQNALRTLKIQLTEYPKQSEQRQLKIINSKRIDTILDIGANIGQYGRYLRKMGYDKKIVSFEPMRDAFVELEKNARKDDKWIAKQYALGNENGSAIINISANSQSSSILQMLPSHVENAPSSIYIKKEHIEIKKLDTVIDEICDPSSTIMLKIDTQGFEKSVLDGAERSIGRVDIVELELSLVPLYENPILFVEMIEIMKEMGFELYAVEHVFSNPTTGQTLQVDGTFVRKT